MSSPMKGIAMIRSMVLRCGIAAFAILLSGCASGPYYRVESKLVESARGYGDADVTATPAYRKVRKDTRKIALRPPDVCADQGIAAGGGEEKLAGGVLRTRCGVEMFELERALAKSGYEVISWSAIDNKAERERMAPRRAARDLEVDVLLQVNALERTQVKPSRDARWERRYYHSTKRGDRAKPAKVGGAQRDTFDRLIDVEENRILLTRQGATINASAVLVESGSTIWFYEATRLDSDAADPVVALRLFCKKEVCEQVKDKEPVVSTGPSTGGFKAISFGGEAADEQQVVYRELIRTLVGDLVESFSSGGG